MPRSPYGYDAKRQLTSALSDTDSSYDYSYQFDNIGNWLSGKIGNTGGAPTTKRVHAERAQPI